MGRWLSSRLTAPWSPTGDIDQPFYLRSAAKPFQALASQEHGAGLGPLPSSPWPVLPMTGIRCTSGWWRSMLARVGLGEADLQCPASWPLSDAAANVSGSRWVEWGHEPFGTTARASMRMAPACHARGWPLDGYLAPIIRFRWSSPTWSPIWVVSGVAGGC